MLLYIISFIFLCIADKNITGNGWEYYCKGNCDQDAITPTIGGTLNMGGGGDIDVAFRWFIKNSGGGDILILRAYGTDAYNDYIYGLGKVNSVSTFVLQKSASNDEFVKSKIKNCEALWFAGGDQWNYYSYWKNTPLQDAFQYLVEKKRVTLGGTSAGMAIMADMPFTAQFDGITSAEALINPYDPKLTLGSSFIHSLFMKNTVTDMHFVQRNRMGRSLAFLARLVTDSNGLNHMGIACDEATSFAISEKGIGVVMVDPAKKMDKLYHQCYIFTPRELPSVCSPGVPLSFANIEVTRLASNERFDMNSWKKIDGKTYIINVNHGNLSTIGNGGEIY